MNIIRKYDIRGTFGKTLFLNDAICFSLGFGLYLQKTYNTAFTVYLGMDGRSSSPTLKTAIIEGLSYTKASIVDLGLIPTPTLYYKTNFSQIEATAGIMITGSHNPPDDNGFKVCVKGAQIAGDALLEIYEMGHVAFENIHFKTKPKEVLLLNPKHIYLSHILQGIHYKQGIRVAWDCGGGAACSIIEQLQQYINDMQPGFSHFSLNNLIDPIFSCHPPDPSNHDNLKQLITEMEKQDCKIGFAFDGDCDRIGAIFRFGTELINITGEVIISILAIDLLYKQGHASIIVDIKTSIYVVEFLESLGITVHTCQTGHSFIKKAMRDTGADIAGEMSGHIFFKDKCLGFDDAIFAAIKLLELATNGKLETYLNMLPHTYSTPEIRLKCSLDDKSTIIDKIKAKLQDDGVMYEEVDGVRVILENGWWIVRQSNTEECISLRIEGRNPSGLSDAIRHIKQYFDSDINLEFII